MASTTFSGPVTSTNGFIGAVTGSVDGTAGYIQLRTATSAEIAAVADAVNTTGKAAGTIVFDTTLSTLKIATGALAADTWVNADGTTAVTPT
jgi:hypothetical protein